jgi:hypothetical protein
LSPLYGLLCPPVQEQSTMLRAVATTWPSCQGQGPFFRRPKKDRKRSGINRVIIAVIIRSNVLRNP